MRDLTTLIFRYCSVFKISEWENEINRLLEQWLLELESVVEKLNQHFSSFFENMGCSGEVHLQKPDDKVINLRFLVMKFFEAFL